MFQLIRLVALFLSVVAAALVGCASQTLPDHGFDFRPLADSPAVRVLDWRYSVWKPEQWQTDAIAKDGVGLHGKSVRGRFPVGDHIYVKWQVPPEEKIHERSIDLKGLLPRSMEARELRLIFIDSTPHVFLIAPDNSEPNFRSFRGRGYSFQSIRQIYPASTGITDSRR